jgi:hypothetical protein
MAVVGVAGVVDRGGCGGYGGRLDAADVVGFVDMADTVEGSLRIWESSRLFCSHMELNSTSFY